MQTQPKAEQLNIRVTSDQKAKLAEAAQIENMNVSQFVMTKALLAAEDVINRHICMRVSREEFKWLLSKLEEPPMDIPELRELFSKPSALER